MRVAGEQKEQKGKREEAERNMGRGQDGALLQAKTMSRTMISLQSNGMPRIILCLSLSMLASPLGNSTNRAWSEKRMAVAMKLITEQS